VIFPKTLRFALIVEGVVSYAGVGVMVSYEVDTALAVMGMGSFR